MEDRRRCWDSIVVSIISIAASITAYFIIKYLLKRTADSLNLDKKFQAIKKADREWVNNDLWILRMLEN